MTPKIYNETALAFICSNFACVEDEKKGICQASTPATSTAEKIVSIERLCRKISNTKSVVFKANEKGKWYLKMTNNDIGKWILDILLHTDFDELQDHFPQHVFNPYIDRMIAMIVERDLQAYAKSPGWSLLHEKTILVVDVLNDFVQAYRAETNSNAFKNKVRNYMRRAKENENELKNLIDAVFAKSANALLIRIDLAYNHVHQTLRGYPVSIEISDVRKHRKLLLKEVRRAFKDSLVTYAWKLEHGRVKSYQHHFLFFFDSSKLKQDEAAVGKLIGDKWKECATEGIGVHYLLNGKSVRYKSECTGILSNRDGKSIRNLKDVVATYMTKVDYFMNLDSKQKCRAFGKGAIPHRKPNSVRRPRAAKPRFGLSGPPIA